MARWAEILERRQRDGATFLYCSISMDGDPDPDTGNPTTIDLGEVEVADGTPAEVRSALTDEAKRLLQLPVGKLINL